MKKQRPAKLLRALREALDKRGEPRSHIAERLGWSPSRLHQYLAFREPKRISLADAERLAEAIGLEIRLVRPRRVGGKR